MFTRNKSITRLFLTPVFFTTLAANAWDIESVDVSGNVGTHASLAVSPAGIPHISYFDAMSTSLKYATKLSGAWSIETVDNSANVGRYNSIAIGGDGVIHVSYYDTTNGDLKRAWKSGAAWSFESVDSTGDVGQFTSLAINPVNQPVISYYNVTNPAIKVAYLEGSWQIKQGPDAVLSSSTSLKLASIYPYPLVAYFDNTDRKLKLAIYDLGGSLPSNTVDALGWGVENVIAGTIIDSISLELASSAEPRISYADTTATATTVTYIEKNCIASGCLTQTTPTFPTGEGSWGTPQSVQDVGSGPAITSLVIGSDGNPRISYLDRISGWNLVYAIRSGGTWTLDVVDSQGNVGLNSSLGLDVLDNPHIAYYDETNSNLKYATLGSANNSGICVQSSRVFSRFPKSWGITFVSTDDPSCKVTDAVVNLQPGNQMSRDTSGFIYCIPSGNVWNGEGSAQVTVDVNPDLENPIDGFVECITDSFGNYWDTGQAITVNLNCSAGNVSLTGLYNDFFDTYDNIGAFKVSRASLGTCLPPVQPIDYCPDLPGIQSVDSDGDGLGDECDNCPDVYNPGQEDADGDGIDGVGGGDACEPECSDGLDNDGDGNIDHPDDAQCDDPDDDREAADLEICLPLSKQFVSASPRILKAALRIDRFAGSSSDQRGSIWDWIGNQRELGEAQLAVVHYVLCPERIKPADDWNVKEIVDILSRICLTGPIGFDLPQRCPPLDCDIDGPGCMDPYQHVMVDLPDEALITAAMGARGIISTQQMNANLADMMARDEISIQMNPERRRFLPNITIASGLLLIVTILGVGLAIGYSVARRRRRNE